MSSPSRKRKPVPVRDHRPARRRTDPTVARWAAGYGPIRHTPLTRARVRAMAERLAADRVRGDGVPLYRALHAADRIASAGMWLLVHPTDAPPVYLHRPALRDHDFKPTA